MTGNIREQLVDSSRRIADIVVANIGHDEDLFSETVLLMFEDKYPISMRAARIVQLISHKYPEMIKPHIPELIGKFSGLKVEGARRSILKILSETPVYISEDLLGELADKCFGYISDMNEAIAVRAFSIDLLMKIAKKYPEIKPEIAAVLESIIPEASVGLKNKCQKMIVKLYKTRKP
jgi:hypothetical protein